MNEQSLTPEERLKQLNAERKNLKVQVYNERKARLDQAAKMRVGRDENIEKIQKKLKKVQAAIYQYNKLGNVAKVEFDVLGLIQKEMNSDVVDTTE